MSPFSEQYQGYFCKQDLLWIRGGTTLGSSSSLVWWQYPQSFCHLHNRLSSLGVGKDVAEGAKGKMFQQKSQR
jgi:hypothetical protein